ncbi:ABC transporter substrate-binding protein [Nocardia sp. NBC_01730]|nr:ABC transporter substrate-binding protein [Nocardia sp. NBC_01730]
MAGGDAHAEIIFYNSTMLTADRAPKDWDDLITPNMKEKLLIRDVAASGTMRSIISALIARSGDPQVGYAYLRALDRNTKDYVANPSDLYLRIRRQEAPVSVWNLQDVLIQRGAGAPLTVVMPARVGRGFPAPHGTLYTRSDMPLHRPQLRDVKGWLHQAALSLPVLALTGDQPVAERSAERFYQRTLDIVRGVGRQDAAHILGVAHDKVSSGPAPIRTRPSWCAAASMTKRKGSRIRPGRIPAEGGVCVVGSGAVGRAIVGFSRYA